ncbi:MAG: nucleotidyl transferase AbiEii/AbiGii toxin family protein [Lachnospiraceae bacterium]|nr:nucleotidyl transferase AbiEii/AbiGii toxin family protein [Lachnospiraceae bacterium]
MLTKDNFTVEHIRELQSRSRRDPVLLERSVYAFGLLEAIARVGMPFIFKGGSCLMLLLEHPMRLSTDIDIVVKPGTDIEDYIKRASEIFPFISCEEQIRVGKNNIEKRHFKFIYSSPINKRNIYILLDVLFEDAKYTCLVSKQIKNELLITDGEMLDVSIPSVECVLGDKLTAFAPHTTGVRLNDNKDMEIAKQFYDVLTLINIASDFEKVRDTYYKLVQDEIAYRGLDISSEDALRDTYMTAACIASRGKIAREDYGFYLRGIRDVRNHIFYENFSAEVASQRAPIIMYLSACMIKAAPFEKKIDAKEYINRSFIDSNVKAVKEQRKINPVGYAYAIKADSILNG